MAVLKVNRQRGIGLGALLLSGFFYLFAIPTWVSSPSNVSNIVLSPLFWPNIIAIMLGAVGVALFFSAQTKEDVMKKPHGGLQRLSLMTVLLVVYLWALSVLGMVWASCLAFLGLAVLLGERRVKILVLVALLVPIALYAFFAHVAGVAIPQGSFTNEYFRLP